MRTVSMIFACVLCMAVAVSAGAATYTANFDSDAEGWDGDGPAWVTTGGEDGGYYSGTRDTGGGPYLLPPNPGMMYGDVAGNFGNVPIEFSYYLKDISGNATGVAAYMFADTDTTAGWDTLWYWSPADTTPPADWTQYSFTVDPSASTPDTGWTLTSGSGSWADSWQGVAYWNFWTSSDIGATQIHGIDTVLIQSVPEPSTIIMLLGVALMALVRRRK